MSIRDDMVQKVLGNPGKYSIQQLQAAMQSGSLPAYVVVPIIQDKVQQQKQMQAAMQQQQPPQSTIAEQVMQEADMMGGVAQLPSNLPQEYAQGGIVAFDEGGEVERFAGGGRSQYEEYIRRRATAMGIDPDTAMRLFATESSFDPRAVSPKGAVGLGQLMSGTATEMGLSPEERTDPYKNIDASLGYFGKQLKKYGSPDLAAVAYNYGPGNLDKHLKQHGGLNPDALPAETQGYRAKLGFSPDVAAALTRAVPVSSAVAAETPSAAPSVYTGPEGIARLVNAAPSVAAGVEQPISDIGYGDVVRGGGIEEVRRQSEPSSPFSRGVRSLVSGFQENQANAELVQALARKFGQQASVFGLFKPQSDEERQAAIKLMNNVDSMPTAELRMALQQPTAVDAVKAIGVSRVPDQVERAMIAKAAVEKAPPAQPQKETQVAEAPTQQPGDIAPAAIDIMSMVQDAPAQIKAALGEMRDKRKEELDKMDEPSIALLEQRYAERGKKLESRKEDAAMNAALAFLSGVAGTRGHWAEAIGKGGKDMLNSLVTSQAAQQAAQDKFNEAADNLELRKLALKKDNAKAADAYGEKYASLIMQGTKLQVDGAYHFNKNQIDSFDADTKRQALTAGKKKLDIALAQAQTGNLKARATVMAMGNKLLQAWETSGEKRDAEISVTEKYGKDWRKLPLKNEKRLQADAELQQAKKAWVENNMALQAAMGMFDGGGTSKISDASDLLSGNI